MYIFLEDWQRFSHFSMSYTTLAEAIAEFARSRHLERRLRGADLFRLWPQIVGERIARRAKPAHLQRGRLVIECGDSVWRAELQFLKPELLEKIHDAVGEGIVKEIFLK
jgi:predicted nucleic acid-binding Zn ribbon protein